MNYTVLITATAKADLYEIAFYLAEKTKDREVARRITKELFNECKTLEEFPNRGSLPKDRILLSAGFRFLVCRDYLIFYKVDEQKRIVTVRAIINGKRDYMKIISKYL